MSTDKSHLISSEKARVFSLCLYKQQNLNKRILDIVFEEYAYGRIETIVVSVLEEQIKLIHTLWVIPNGFVAVKLRLKYSITVIVSAHGSDIHGNALKPRTSFKRTLFTLEKVSRVIFGSEALRKVAMNFGYSRKLDCDPKRC